MTKSKELNSNKINESKRVTGSNRQDKNKNLTFGEVPIKHLLVDLDGTLLGNHELPLSIDFIKQSLRTLKPYGGWRQAAKILLKINSELKTPRAQLKNSERAVAAFSKWLKKPEEEARSMLRNSIQLIFPTLKKHFYPIPGAKDFLNWAKDRYTLVLATNPVWPIEIVHLRLQWAGVDESLFKFITHVNDMVAVKPHPTYYQQILTLQDLPAQNTLLIGDDIKMDLPATAVGIRVFIVGNYKKLSPLKTGPRDATALRGSYQDLRRVLEANSNLGVPCQ